MESYKTAVNGLSFVANEGEIYGLLGPNGAGKTTTLRIISTLIKQDKGDVIIEGLNTKTDTEKVRAKIGFLTSELKLEDFFTPNYLFDYFGKLHNIPDDVLENRKKNYLKIWHREVCGGKNSRFIYWYETKSFNCYINRS